MQAIRRLLERENELEDRLLRERDEVRDIIELVSMTICSLRHSQERARVIKESQNASTIEVKIERHEAEDNDEEDEDNSLDVSQATRKKRRYSRKPREDGESLQSNDLRNREEEFSEEDEDDEMDSEERMGGSARQYKQDLDSGAVEKYMIESSTAEATNDPYKHFVNTKIEAVLDGIPRDMTGGLKKQLGLEFARRKNREMTDREWKDAKDVFLQMMSTVLIRIRKHNPHGYLYTPCIRHRHEKIRKNFSTKPSPCWCDGTTFRKKDVRSIRELTTTLLTCYLNNYLEGENPSSSFKSNNKDSSKASSNNKRARVTKASRDSTSSSSSQ